jgi:spore germination protein YaaH
MQTIVLYNQTLADIAIRFCGTIEAIADIAILNSISITDDLVPGQIILIPVKDYNYQEVINFFSVNKIDPATTLTDEHRALTEGNSGIGFWELGNNFIVQ